MDEEKEEGYFDDDGNFVWDEDSKKVQEEAWLDNVSEQQMNAAKNAKSLREFRDEQAEETMTEEKATRTLATLLNSRETVLQALKRLGSKKNSRGRPGGKRKRIERKEPVSALTAEEKQQFEQVTEAADFFMRIGEVDIYDRIKEEFLPEEQLLEQRRCVQFAAQREDKNEENLPKQEKMWEYKTTDGQIHGPFPTSSFVHWQQQGYFRGDEAVDMREWRSRNDVSVNTSQKSIEKHKQEVEKLSVEQEMLNDFEDSADEAGSLTVEDKKEEDENEWRRSNTIDFLSL